MNEKMLDRIGTIILFGTLLVTVPRFIAVFMRAEPDIMGLPTSLLTGIGFGVLLEGGSYYTIRAWFLARRRKLKWADLLLAAFVVQLVIAPILITPALVGWMLTHPSELSLALAGDVSNGTSEVNVQAVWIWSAVVSIAPVLLLAAVALAQGMIVPQSKSRAGSSDAKGRSEAATSGSKVTESDKAGEQAGVKVTALKEPLVCEFCQAKVDKNGVPFKNRNALAGHQRWCTENPKNKVPSGINGSGGIAA